jgi:hypothetical protein
MLAHHKIDTHVLKTQPRLGQPLTSQTLGSSGVMLTPQRYGQGGHQQYYHKAHPGIRTGSQRPLPDKFYTNSDIFPPELFEEDQGPPDQVREKQDTGETLIGTTSFQDTAVIALKFSQSLLTFYKTVSPYFTGENA